MLGNARRHVGLGFTKEKPAEPVSSSGEPANGDRPASSEPEKPEASSEENQSKPDSTSDGDTSKKKGMLNFVKASS